MGKVWNWNSMYGTKLKKFDGWVLHTTNEDGNGGEHDAAALLEDHEGGPEDGYGGEEDVAAPLEDHGYNGEEDAADPLEDDDGDQDDRGAASEDSDDDIVPFGRRVVQLLAIHANFRICAINGYDWQLGRCIYRQHEREVQEEGMVNLVPIGPCVVLMAYSAFTLEVFHSITRAGNTTTTGNKGLVGFVHPSERTLMFVVLPSEWNGMFVVKMMTKNRRNTHKPYAAEALAASWRSHTW